MRFRQVHLDFHTSEAIAGIGAEFNKAQFQAMLKEGHIDSITIFAKCHHGWAYHKTQANEMHPGLAFDLLGAQIEAAHEIGVKTPVYLSAGLDERLARRHPEWLYRQQDESINWTRDFLTPGYHEFCLNTPYLELLLSQVEEVTRNYDVDGIFLDIVGARTCYCQSCVATLRGRGQDPRDRAAVVALGEEVYANYTRQVRERIHAIKPGTPIFHNGSHIRRGRRDLAEMNTHLELESLPTGGWGYDHFPLSARYVQQLGMDYLGMTGKFHLSWGEFGGYKHPNALRYETALSLANGARCSIGDQLAPSGKMDEATYRLIGAAYAEVEQKEAWCEGVTNIADVALLSVEAVPGKHRDDHSIQSDPGAVRMLLEGNVLFDIIDTDADFTAYKVIVLPDHIRLTAQLADQLNSYTAQGGKLLATGESGLNEAGDAFAVDLGVSWVSPSAYKPDYFRPDFSLPSLGTASFVMYEQGQLVELAGAQSLGFREKPYFNRDLFTFCSHQHTPSSGEHAGPGMSLHESGIYLGWPVFHEYATKGSLALKEIVLHALGLLLGDKQTLQTSLPAQGVTTLQHQQQHGRYVHHLLYASPVKRGNGVEIIEDIIPLHDIKSSVRLPAAAKRVYLAPQGEELAFEQNGNIVSYVLPRLECHQMIVIEA
ncbi:alpha-amylase family protein [Paenibacillus pinihumi]|uniref:alpha-amylase family protein n=1 Tax=Paenibacillus pinihumi TaxID=669462 RepID=UPI000428847F|nr:alpha-amylase family protein [Paenibacillus pinihumi]